MIVAVTPNPAVDVTYRVAAQQIGVTQRVLDVARRPGGKGLNVARVLQAQGLDTRSVLPLGGDAGAWVERACHDLGLPTVVVPVTGETRTTVTVVDDAAHPTMFGEPGPETAPHDWERVDRTVSAALATADALVVSGSLPVNAPADAVRPWVVEARSRGVLVVVDCSGPALLAAAEAGATVCKPNREELLQATGSRDERFAALDLLERGAGTVVVSRGSDGIAAHSRTDVVEVPAVRGVAGNPTGAGDAATAGLVAALAAGADLPAALRRAAAFGAAAVLRPVAGEVDLAAAHRFLTQLDPTGSPA